MVLEDTTRIERTGHIGVDAKFLWSLIEERGNRGFLQENGVSISKAKALRYIDAEIAKGRRIFTQCPTPNSDGSCPGHPKELGPQAR